ncbi:MAG: hypothetical protein MJ252_16620 [archaeon]|nr:hypothetical protein [archaeon]
MSNNEQLNEENNLEISPEEAEEPSQMKVNSAEPLIEEQILDQNKDELINNENLEEPKQIKEENIQNMEEQQINQNFPNMPNFKDQTEASIAFSKMLESQRQKSGGGAISMDKEKLFETFLLFQNFLNMNQQMVNSNSSQNLSMNDPKLNYITKNQRENIIRNPNSFKKCSRKNKEKYSQKNEQNISEYDYDAEENYYPPGNRGIYQGENKNIMPSPSADIIIQNEFQKEKEDGSEKNELVTPQKHNFDDIPIKPSNTNFMELVEKTLDADNYNPPPNNSTVNKKKRPYVKKNPNPVRKAPQTAKTNKSKQIKSEESNKHPQNKEEPQFKTNLNLGEKKKEETIPENKINENPNENNTEIKKDNLEYPNQVEEDNNSKVKINTETEIEKMENKIMSNNNPEDEALINYNDDQKTQKAPKPMELSDERPIKQASSYNVNLEESLTTGNKNDLSESGKTKEEILDRKIKQFHNEIVKVKEEKQRVSKLIADNEKIQNKLNDEMTKLNLKKEEFERYKEEEMKKIQKEKKNAINDTKQIKALQTQIQTLNQQAKKDKDTIENLKIQLNKAQNDANQKETANKAAIDKLKKKIEELSKKAPVVINNNIVNKNTPITNNITNYDASAFVAQKEAETIQRDRGHSTNQKVVKGRPNEKKEKEKEKSYLSSSSTINPPNTNTNIHTNSNKEHSVNTYPSNPNKNRMAMKTATGKQKVAKTKQKLSTQMVKENTHPEFGSPGNGSKAKFRQAVNIKNIDDSSKGTQNPHSKQFSNTFNPNQLKESLHLSKEDPEKDISINQSQQESQGNETNSLSKSPNRPTNLKGNTKSKKEETSPVIKIQKTEDKSNSNIQKSPNTLINKNNSKNKVESNPQNAEKKESPEKKTQNDSKIKIDHFPKFKEIDPSENYDFVIPEKYHKGVAYSLIKTVEKNDKNMVVNLYTNNKRELIFQSGVKKEIFGDGYQIVYFTNGDMKQIFPDGKMIYYFSEAKTVQTTLPSGISVYKFSTGQIEKHFPDGTKQIAFPDGSIRYIYDGFEETHFADGTITKVDSNGVATVRHADGTEEIQNPNDTSKEGMSGGNSEKKDNNQPDCDS